MQRKMRNMYLVIALIALAGLFLIARAFFVNADHLYIKNGTGENVTLLGMHANGHEIYSETKAAPLTLNASDTAFFPFSAVENNSLIISFKTDDMSNSRQFECQFRKTKRFCTSEISLRQNDLSCLPCE